MISFILAAVLLTLSVYLRNQYVSPEPWAIVANINQLVERELGRLQTEANLIQEAISKNQEWPSVKNAFFLYDSTGIIQWNTHQYFPEPSGFAPDTVVHVRNGSAHFLLKQFLLPDQKYLIGYLPLQSSFPIQNQYLTSNLNKNIFQVPGVSLTLSGNVYPVKFQDRDLFVVSINSTLTIERQFGGWSWIIFSFGISLLFYAGWIVVSHLLVSNRREIAAVLVFLILLAVRALMVYGQFPGTGNEWAVFDPRQFAASRFNDSIGNLFLNTVAFLIASLAAYFFLRGQKFIKWRSASRFTKTIIVSFFLILCFATQLIPFLYLETIYHNSSISPDITGPLDFESVRWFALACVVLSSITGFYFFFTFFRISIRITQSHAIVFFTAMVIAAFTVFLYHLLSDRNYEIPLALTALNLVLLFYSSVSHQLKFISSRTFSLILLALVVFCVQAALAIRMLSIEAQREKMFKFGNSFLVERDILGEYLLDQTIAKVEADDFIRQQVLNPFASLNSISQKITRVHLSSYFDRYDTRLYLFDNRGKPVGDETLQDLPSLMKDFVPLAQTTGYRGIYFIDNPDPANTQNGNQFLKRYMAVIPIKFHVTAYIVLDLTLRQILPVTVFPKLLLDSRFSDYASSSEYSFAIFDKGKMINSAGEFTYQTSSLIQHITNPEWYQAGIYRDDFFHVGMEGPNGQVAIVSTSKYSNFTVLTNFAFYFLIGLAVVMLAFVLVNVRTLSRISLTYSDRIQLYVYLALVLPLLVIAITILRINSRADTQRLEVENAAKAERMANSIASLLSDSPGNLQQELARQALAAGVDATVYLKSGVMLASSQPSIFSNQLVSKFINPAALSEISAGNFLFALDDEVGKLKFRNTYAAVRSPSTGEVLAILSLPFFESQASTEKNQINLIANILTVLVAVFLFFYVLSFIALNWLTSPLRVIAATFQRTTFSGTNRKLIWNSKDEVGSMVKEYNKMVDNLEKSRAELEKRQREAAWREMARQVAHEIKNPLTPIKLTLQQMENSLKQGQAEPEKSIQSIKSVLHQVDILNDIASSFSAFAQMPELKLEPLNVNDLLQGSVDLFSDFSEGKVMFENNGQLIMATADRKLFSRIFSNIILNALQSRKENQTGRVDIQIKVHKENCVISFSDNGKGMTLEVMDKIFIPYFSTKETGSGLGLAIARQGIEQAGGKIWCESKPGVGSQFYISLPSLPIAATQLK